MDETHLKKIVRKLDLMYDELKEVIASAKSAQKEKDFFTHAWKVKREHRKVLGKKYVSMEELFESWMAIWKAEGRLSANGLRVRPGKEEAKILGIKEDEPIYIYDLSTKCMDLFSDT